MADQAPPRCPHCGQITHPRHTDRENTAADIGIALRHTAMALARRPGPIVAAHLRNAEHDLAEGASLVENPTAG